MFLLQKRSLGLFCSQNILAWDCELIDNDELATKLWESNQFNSCNHIKCSNLISFTSDAFCCALRSCDVHCCLLSFVCINNEWMNFTWLTSWLMKTQYFHCSGRLRKVVKRQLRWEEESYLVKDHKKIYFSKWKHINSISNQQHSDVLIHSLFFSFHLENLTLETYLNSN
jgi:hypothetical protein